MNDYAHHPKEIEAYLRSIKTQRKGKLHVVFQPHRFSRTRNLLGELAGSLRSCHRLYLVDVYAASEVEQDGGKTSDLLDACRSEGIDSVYCDDPSSVSEAVIAGIGEEETTVVFLGAGQTDVMSAEFADRLAGADPLWGELYRMVGRVAESSSSFKEDEPLAKKTTMRIGGVAERYIEPASTEELDRKSTRLNSSH